MTTPNNHQQQPTKPVNTTEDVERYSTDTPPPFDVNAPGQPNQPPVTPPDPTRRVPTPPTPTNSWDAHLANQSRGTALYPFIISEPGEYFLSVRTSGAVITKRANLDGTPILKVELDNGPLPYSER